METPGGLRAGIFIRAFPSAHVLRQALKKEAKIDDAENGDKMHVSPEKERLLNEEMAALGIRQGDIEEKFVRSSGHGGQKVNKTSTCVSLKHIPTGIEVKCMAERSQSVNRFLARRILLEKIKASRGIETTSGKEAERIRKQKARRKRRTKDKMTYAGDSE